MLVLRPSCLCVGHALHSPLACPSAPPTEHQSTSPRLGLRACTSLLHCTRPRLMPRRDASLMIRVMRHHLLSVWLHSPALRPSLSIANTHFPCGPCIAEGRNSSVLVPLPLEASRQSTLLLDRHESHRHQASYSAPQSLWPVLPRDYAYPSCIVLTGFTLPWTHQESGSNSRPICIGLANTPLRSPKLRTSSTRSSKHVCLIS